MNWFVKLGQSEFGGGIRSAITWNKYGTAFFTVYGNTMPIKDQLKAMKFRYYQGRWGQNAETVKNDPVKMQNLQDIGVPTDVLNQELVKPEMQQTQDPQQPQQPQQQTQDQPQASEADAYITKMQQEVEQAVANAEGGPAKAMLDYVDQMLDKLAAAVDDTERQAFIKKYLAFAAKFHNYSFGNQMLIMMQKPDAQKVAGKSTWASEFGREVKPDAAPITIIRPNTSTSKEGKELKKKMPKEQWNQVKGQYERTMFAGASVYDISDTEPLTWWKGPNGEGPFEIPKMENRDDNEALEEVTALVDAASSWAGKLGIKIEDEELRENHSGYSSGGRVAINSTYDGVRRLGTLVHELAHEILHTSKEGRAQGKEEKWTSKDIEIDAEATAYIVLDHYGFPSKEAVDYISLFQRATGEDIKKRISMVSKAVGTIISGISKEISSAPAPDEIGN